MDYRERITIEPAKRDGKPYLRGLRITVCDILHYLAGGVSKDEILSDFPDLERDDIRASLAFAAERGRRLASDVAAVGESTPLTPPLLLNENLSPVMRSDCIIVSNDSDCLLRGAPPKVIWTRLGNCTTADVEQALRSRLARVVAFAEDSAAAQLLLARR